MNMMDNLDFESFVTLKFIRKCHKHYEESLIAQYGNTGCGVFKWGVQN